MSKVSVVVATIPPKLLPGEGGVLAGLLEDRKFDVVKVFAIPGEADDFVREQGASILQGSPGAVWVDEVEMVEAPRCEGEPTPMLLWCPSCKERHVDEGEWTLKKHHTHACQHCGMVWRPAIVHTVGVQFLPGFKNEPHGTSASVGDDEDFPF